MDADRHIAELTTLNQIATTLNEWPDLASALRASLERLARIMGLTTGWIFLCDLRRSSDQYWPCRSRTPGRWSVRWSSTRASRHFDDDDVRLMDLMANQAAIAIVTTGLQERAHAEQQLRRELELARDIQTSFVPQQLPKPAGWEFGAYYSAAREIGGDFYDFIPLRDLSQRPTGMPGAFLEGGNLLRATVHWQFTSEIARVRLKSLYPSI